MLPSKTARNSSAHDGSLLAVTFSLLLINMDSAENVRMRKRLLEALRNTLLMEQSVRGFSPEFDPCDVASGGNPNATNQTLHAFQGLSSVAALRQLPGTFESTLFHPTTHPHCIG